MKQVDVPGMGLVEFPDNMTDAQIEGAIKEHFRREKLSAEMEHPQAPQTGPKYDASQYENTLQFGYPPLTGSLDTGIPVGPTTHTAFAGMGKSYADTARGVGNLLSNQLVSQQDIEESRRLDAPLMNTAPGMLGNIGGHASQMALLGPMTTPLKAAALSGAYGAAQPGTLGERAVMGGLSALGGAAGQKVGQLMSKGVGEATPAMREANRRAMKLGAKLTPGQMTRSSKLLRKEAGMASTPSGGARMDALKQHNQTLLNRVWTKAVGEQVDEITPEYLGGAANRIGQQIDNALTGVDVPLDNTFQTRVLNSLVKYQKTISGKGDAQIDDVLDWVAEQGSTITGKNFQKVRSDLVKETTTAWTNGKANLGEVLTDILDALDDAAGKVIPKAQQEAYAAARNQWKNLLAVEKNLNGFNVSGPKMANHLARNKFTRNAYLRNKGNIRPEERDAYDLTRFASANRSIVGDSGTATRADPLLRKIARTTQAPVVGGLGYLAGLSPGEAAMLGLASVPVVEGARAMKQAAYFSPLLNKLISSGGIEQVSPHVAKLLERGLLAGGAGTGAALPQMGLLNSP